MSKASETDSPREWIFTFEATAGELATLVGPVEENIRIIERSFDVKIQRQGPRFTISGAAAAGAFRVLELAAGRIQSGEEVTAREIELFAIDEKRSFNGIAASEAETLKTRKIGLKPRTPHQRDYIRAILKTDITFGIGPAGTGKTYLAVAAAVDAYERNVVERIVLTRPAIEAGERLGFLPGDLAQKVDPYLRPLYDALYDLFGFDRTQKLIQKQVIEIAPLAYMRGRTLNNAFVILDEAQNTTGEQMKMFLTRIGFGTHAVVNGDVTQIDLPRGVKSGLAEAARILADVPGISFVRFDAADVVRHPLVGAIVRAYDAARAKEGEDHRGK